MKKDLAALSFRAFDLLIVGGGIQGAGIAWDAAQRGLSCALVDAGDFASGASSKTTKLIHGGIRYLEQLDFRLVREALAERQILLQNAPHLVQPLPFLIPVIGRLPRPWPLVWAGVWLYERLAGKRSLKPHRFLNGQEVPKEEPLLAGSHAAHGAVYFDAQMDDVGLVLEVLKAAFGAGAVLANHARVTGWSMKEGRISVAQVEDRLSGKSLQIQAKVIVNASGPWVDRLRQLADPQAAPIVRPSKGSHLLYPDLGLKHALLFSSEKDGRVLFLIPWRGLTLIGTTDLDYSSDPGQARIDRQEVDYLLSETNRILPALRLEKEKVIAAFSGVRPLVAAEKKDPWSISRMHRIHPDSNGMISVVGGKFTTFRRIAQEVVDQVAVRFPEKKLAPCRTQQSPLGSASGQWRSGGMREKFQALLGEGGIYHAEIPRLVHRYGDGVRVIVQWIQEDRGWAEPLCPHHPFIRAEVRYAVEQEMALTLSDLLWRRLQVGFSPCHGLDVSEGANRIMARLLNWSPEEQNKQLAAYRQEVEASSVNSD